MHNYWVGVAADVWRSGDKSLEWILREAGAGEVFAAGHAESGNETSLLMSITKAERVQGGDKFTGRKSFGSLTPVWTRLGFHGLDTSDPAHPKVVHAFMPRETGGYTIKETWDVMGMRATRSDDTILEGAFVPDKYIARVIPMGFAGADFFVLAIFAWALLGFSNIYYGLAKRVTELTIGHVKEKGSLAMTRSMAWRPEVQHDVAEMVMELESIAAHVATITRDWSEGVQHPDWTIKIVATKYRVVEAVWRIVDRAMDALGVLACSRKANSNASSAMRAPAIFIRPIPLCPTKSSPSLPLDSTPTKCHAGADAGARNRVNRHAKQSAVRLVLTRLIERRCTTLEGIEVPLIKRTAPGD